METLQPVQLTDAQVTAEFDQITAGLSLPEQTYLGHVPDALDAFMQTQLAYGNLSLDDAYTEQTVKTDKGMEALMGP